MAWIIIINMFAILGLLVLKSKKDENRQQLRKAKSKDFKGEALGNEQTSASSASLVGFLKDWKVVMAIPKNGLNVPISTPEGDYSNTLEWLLSERERMADFTGYVMQQPVKVTFFQDCILGEMPFGTSEVLGLIIEPICSFNEEPRLQYLAKNSAVSALLSAVFAIRNNEADKLLTIENTILTDIYNYIVSAQRYGLFETVESATNTNG